MFTHRLRSQFNAVPEQVKAFGEKEVRSFVFKCGQLLFNEFAKYYALDKSKDVRPYVVSTFTPIFLHISTH